MITPPFGVLSPIEAIKPGDQCCLVVQMPSVEEMRKEVADITCQMQSVYFDDAASPTKQHLALISAENDTTNLSTEAQMCTKTVDASKSPPSTLLFREFDPKATLLSRKDFSRFKQQKSRTLDRATSSEHDNILSGLNEPVLSSSPPREMQICEEFVINGKRYRQTYQKRVVLDRQTTRDIFLLPANSAEINSGHAEQKSVEYTSPNFLYVLHNQDHISPVNDMEMCPRPRLDLTVIHSPGEEQNERTCIKPAVAMCPDSAARRNVTNLPTKSSVALQQAHTEVSIMLDTNNESAAFNDEPPKNKQIGRSRSRLLVREFADTFRRHIASTLKRSNSVKVRSGVQIKEDLPSTSRVSPCNGCRAITGYMYQFGAWDNEAPVLDPRLPIARNTKQNIEDDKSGTVIPRPAEWHLAEVGLEPPTSNRDTFVRGRIVSCLQRFTQHSSDSGKALHRSTYVQQTRLVRQRQLLKHGTEIMMADENVDMKPALKRNAAESANEQSQINTDCQIYPDVEMIAMLHNDVPHTTKISELSTSNVHFEPCCQERLQLLQSICPSAAAATILLGRRFSLRINSDSEDETDEEHHNNPRSPQLLNQTSSLVKANSWCPLALITEDLSPYLILNKKENEVQQRDLSPKGNISTNHLLVRGGTLDGLIGHALRLLESDSTGFKLNDLFPQVFRVTYPTFTTPEHVIEKLIQIYVAYAPVEPGCLTSDWTRSLIAARYLVTLANELPFEYRTARLMLLLARFARLLKSDAMKLEKNGSSVSCTGYSHSNNENTQKINNFVQKPDTNEHRRIADSLLKGLPMLSANFKLQDFIKFQNTCSRKYASQTNAPVIATTKHKSNHSPSTAQSNDTILRSKVVNEKSKCEQNSHLYTNGAPINDTNLEHLNLRIPFVLRRVKQFINTDANLIATEITRMEEEKFAAINFQEFLDIRRLEHGEAPTLGVCVEHFNHLTLWARSLLLFFGPKLGEFEASALTENHKSKYRSRKPGNVIPRHNPSQQQLSHTEHSEPFCCEEKCTTSVKNNKSGVWDSSIYNCDPKVISSITTNEQNTAGKRTQNFLSTAHVQLMDQKMVRIRQIGYLNDIFCHMCAISKHLKALKNFSSFLALLLAIEQVPENLLSKKSRMKLSAFSSYMKPPLFTEYRRDLESASLPYLPYLGLIFQQLIHLDAGNPIHLTDCSSAQTGTGIEKQSEAEHREKVVDLMEPFRTPNDKVINVWRCWKHYLILSYFIERKENPETSRHRLPCNKEVQEILNNFEDGLPEAILNKAKDQLLNLKKTKATCINFSNMNIY